MFTPVSEDCPVFKSRGEGKMYEKSAGVRARVMGAVMKNHKVGVGVKSGVGSKMLSFSLTCSSDIALIASLTKTPLNIFFVLSRVEPFFNEATMLRCTIFGLR